jgi:hypothetical protein
MQQQNKLQNFHRLELNQHLSSYELGVLPLDDSGK